MFISRGCGVIGQTPDLARPRRRGIGCACQDGTCFAAERWMDAHVFRCMRSVALASHRLCTNPQLARCRAPMAPGHISASDRRYVSVMRCLVFHTPEVMRMLCRAVCDPLCAPPGESWLPESRPARAEVSSGRQEPHQGLRCLPRHPPRGARLRCACSSMGVQRASDLSASAFTSQAQMHVHAWQQRARKRAHQRWLTLWLPRRYPSDQEQLARVSTIRTRTHTSLTRSFLIADRAACRWARAT